MALRVSPCSRTSAVTIPRHIPKKSIAGLAIFSLKKINIWAGYLAWARRATTRPVNTLLSSEQQRNHCQEKLCSAHASKRRIAGLAIFILKKLVSGLDIWPGLDGPQPAQLIPARRATARPVNTLLSSEQQQNHRQEKLCSAHASKTQILLELLGPSCRPHLVQFSRLYWLHRLTMVWDRDVRKPGESKKNIVVHNKEALAYVRLWP